MERRAEPKPGGKLIKGDTKEHPDWYLTSRQHHECYSGRTALLDELPLVGRIHLLDALPDALVPHSHPGIYEAHFILDGSLAFTAGGKEYEVTGGMVFLTKPGELHGGVDRTLHPAEWYWVHLHFPAARALPGLSSRQTRLLDTSFARIDQTLFPGSAQLRDAFARLLAEHRKPSDFSEVTARAALHELIVYLLRDARRAGSTSPVHETTEEIRRAMGWLEQHVGDPLSVPDLARVAGLSESHFRQRFHQELGLAPSDYLARRRVAHAKELLKRKSLSITEIAFQLGFQSSPYFGAVFRKLTGQTPSEFRRKLVGGNGAD